MKCPFWGMGVNVLFLGLLAGCAVATTLPAGPDVFSLARHPNAVTVAVAEPVDRRINKEQLGAIGFVPLKIKDNPSEFVAKEVIYALYKQRIDAILVQVSAGSPERFTEAMKGTGASGILAISVENILVQASDIMFNPQTSKVVFTATLYDRAGRKRFTKRVEGETKGALDFFAITKDMAQQLLEDAIKDAAANLAKDWEFKDAVESLI